MVEIENLSLSYGNSPKVLKNISLDVKKGECVLFTGKSGSGKSSIINSINGLAVRYDGASMGGTIRIDNKDIKNLELYEISLLVSNVFQNPKTHFFNINTTLELLFYLENIGLSKKQMDERLNDMLDLFPIEHLLNRDIFKLSGGEKQILCIAASYISGTEIIVLDEFNERYTLFDVETTGSSIAQALREEAGEIATKWIHPLQGELSATKEKWMNLIQ